MRHIVRGRNFLYDLTHRIAEARDGDTLVVEDEAARTVARKEAQRIASEKLLFIDVRGEPPARGDPSPS